MTITNPDHWKELYGDDQGPKYAKIVEMIVAINAAGGIGAHSSTHEDGGGDEISVLDLSGLLADAQTPLDHASEHEVGGGDLVDHNSLTNSHNLTTDINHNTILNNHNLTTDIDHSTITGTHNLTTDINHTTIQNIGSNSHPSIDTAITNSTNHIAASNPHSDSAAIGDLHSQLHTMGSHEDDDTYDIITTGTYTLGAAAEDLNLGGFDLYGVVEIRGSPDVNHIIELDAAPDIMHIHPGDEAADKYIILRSEGAGISDPAMYPSETHYGSLGLSSNKWKNIHAQRLYLDAGAAVTDIDIVMQSSPTDTQLLTAQAIKEYADGLGHHTKYALLDDLIANEITVIKAIDDAFINNTKWDYLANMNEDPQTHMSATNPHSGSAATGDLHAESHGLNSHTQGINKVFMDKAGTFTEIALGASGTYLKSAGDGSDLTWDTPGSGANYDADLMIGSGNAEWVYWVFIGTNWQGIADINTFVLGHDNRDGSDCTWGYQLLMPPNRGGKKLYISDISVGVQDADGSNYVNDFVFNCLTDHDSYVTELNIATNQTAPQDTGADYTPGSPIDCSAYRSMYIRMSMVTSIQGAIGISYVRAKCYYV